MFYITISNGLLDPKHFKAMGGDRNSDCIWLFLWLLDKMTIINHETGEGKVLGGKPIKFEEIANDLGMSRKTYVRWIEMLRHGGYIRTTRTPYGLCIVVLKAKKRFGKKVNEDAERCPRDDTSNVPVMTHLYARHDTSNKTVSVDNNSKTLFASRKSDMSWKKYQEPEIDLDTGEPVLPPEKQIPEKDVLWVFELFRDNPAAASWRKIPAQRGAAERLLTAKGKDKIKNAVAYLSHVKADEYAPQVHSPYDLEQKWAKLEAHRDRNG